MSDKVRIALDAMGGDHGPAVVVAGAELALARHAGERIPVLRQCGADRAAARRAAGAQSRVAARPYRGRGADGGQAEPGFALRPLEILDVAGDRRGQEGRGRCRGLGRQYRRADGDVEVQSQNAARHRAAGDRGAVADVARRIDRARCRRLDRRRRRAPRRSRRDGRRHGAHPVRHRSPDGGPAQYRRRGGQGPRRGARSRPHPARGEVCRTSTIWASSKATISARARSTLSSPKALPAISR